MQHHERVELTRQRIKDGIFKIIEQMNTEHKDESNIRSFVGYMVFNTGMGLSEKKVLSEISNLFKLTDTQTLTFDKATYTIKRVKE